MTTIIFVSVKTNITVEEPKVDDKKDQWACEKDHIQNHWISSSRLSIHETERNSIWNVPHMEPVWCNDEVTLHGTNSTLGDESLDIHKVLKIYAQFSYFVTFRDSYDQNKQQQYLIRLISKSTVGIQSSIVQVLSKGQVKSSTIIAVNGAEGSRGSGFVNRGGNRCQSNGEPRLPQTQHSLRSQKFTHKPCMLFPKTYCNNMCVCARSRVDLRPCERDVCLSAE